MNKSIYKSDATLLCYNNNGKEIVLGNVTANHSMSIEDMLDLLEINMDKWSEGQGREDWDYDNLYMRFDFADGFDWRAYNSGELLMDCWKS